jgi:hypothetical protein
MTYVGATDLVGLLPAVGTITATSQPLTMTEVAGIIGRIEANVEGAAAAAGYTVPVSTTATGAFAQVSDAIVQGAGWRVLRRLYPNMGGPNDKTSLAAEMRSSYEAFVKDLKDGKLPLVGAGLDTADSVRELPRSTGQASPLICMDTRF